MNEQSNGAMEAARTRVLARLDSEVVDLDTELQKFLALVKFVRESLQTELTDGLGYKQMGVTPKALKALKELGTILNSATDCQIRLDKTAAARAKKMTKEEYLAAAQHLVLSLPQTEARIWVNQVVKYLDERIGRDVSV